MVICPYCDEHLPPEEYDEYVPDRVIEGFAVPYENLPDRKDEIHVWRLDGNLFMHFTKGENQ